MRPWLSAAVVAAILNSGCVSWEGDCEVDSWATRQGQAWESLNDLKATQRWEAEGPIRWTFQDQGEVTVREWFLEGGPGWEYVRARFHWENTTGKPMERVELILSVEDEQGRRVSAGRARLSHPWGLPLAPNTFFSDEIRVPTRGAHWQPGWRWSLECRARSDDAAPSVALAD